MTISNQNTGYRTIILTVCDYNGHALRREQMTGLPSACDAFRHHYHDELLNQFDRENVRLHVTTRDPTKAEITEGVDVFRAPRAKRRSVGAAVPEGVMPWGDMVAILARGGATDDCACPYPPDEPCPCRLYARLQRAKTCKCGDAIADAELD